MIVLPERIERIEQIERIARFPRDLLFRALMAAGRARVPDVPHFDEALTSVFGEMQKASTCYLEYGSGGSTLQAARLALPTLSVESDAAYAKAVRSKLPPHSSVNILHADIGLVGPWGTPTVRRASADRVRRWSKYVMAPYDSSLSTAFDLVLIDGRFRRACALESARRAALDGRDLTIVFDDYLSRPHYFVVEAWLGPARLVGRAAIFKVNGGNLVRAITEHDVSEAIADWR